MIEVDRILDVEQHLDELDAVIFDLDDTLYSEKQYVRSGYKKIAEYLGKKEMEAAMWTIFEQGGKAIDEALAAFDMFDRKNEALQIYRQQQPDIELYPGVRELMQRIGKTKKTGIITDGRPEGQRAKLKALDIHVDKVIITDELGGIQFRKPNETAFQIMQEYFRVPFGKMVYIGDNIKKDFVAPEKLGMKTIYFRNSNGLYYKI